LSDDDRWRAVKPPARGPSTPPSLQFNPLSTGLGVFAAVTIPIIVIGFGLDGATATIAIVAVLVGIAAGLIAGIWVSGRGGRVWRGPQL
jgi:VIT1/CCC1 family predicted Fe2+/Mn2+ transporter